MSRSVGLAHIIRSDDGPATGVWGVYTLLSAFQPIFAFREGRLSVAAFEGLLRPLKGDAAIAPQAFFSLVDDEDRMHVETLSRTLHILNAGRYLDPATSLFVNFDPSVFIASELTDTTLREMRLVLHEAGIEPERIVCELTEQKAASSDALSDLVAALRGHGFRIAVDDYGSEDSDINRIDALRPDIVKFDAHWIVQLMESKPGAALLQSMVQSFEERGIRTVFEGIEESWQLELAESCGVSMVQGYVLARPELAPTSYAVAGSNAAEAPVTTPAAPARRQDAPLPIMATRPLPAERPVFGKRQG